MENLTKQIICSQPFTVWPTKWTPRFVADAWSNPNADKDNDPPDLIIVNVRMEEAVEGGVKIIDVTKTYPYEFKTAFKLNAKHELEIDTDIVNALFVKYNYPIQAV